MTRKDYRIIAGAIASVVPTDYRAALYQDRLIDALMAALEADNPRFDRVRFDAVCHGE